MKADVTSGSGWTCSMCNAWVPFNGSHACPRLAPPFNPPQTIHMAGPPPMVQVFPCRCGIIHRGEYASEHFAHHNCFHDDDLIEVDPEETPGFLLCPLCGKTFHTASHTAQDDAR